MDGDETVFVAQRLRDGFDRQAGCIRTVDRMVAVFVFQSLEEFMLCLLYTSDAADE